MTVQSQAEETGQGTAVEEAAGGGFAAGSQVLVRDELWMVRAVTMTRHDGAMVEVTGVSPLVRGMDAVFYEKLDNIDTLDPRDTRLVADDSPNHRKARLYLEAIIRKSALPQTERGLAMSGGFLMDELAYQLRPAQKALSGATPQPRILIADVVGLGKTLEIGILLGELIRRGRGERILVVSPQHVLEQFQREMWTRFAIPLVRLDSTGIQRMQQEIPAGRNPFAYFKRVIISVDTLKSKTYAAHLGSTDWDAVVIDESHNLINRGTKNNDLARLLARKTDALILASATPHNGNAVSFAELIGLLDEAAIADPTQYEPQQLEHLYIRRSKTTAEVREGLVSAWADRGPSEPLRIEASSREEDVFADLIERWIPADPGTPTAAGSGLIAYQMLKSFLSSHHALLATIKTRLKTLEAATSDRGGAVTREQQALRRLRKLTERIGDNEASKLQALVLQLKEWGVGPGSDTRVVVFSERIPTLTWLAETVPAALGFSRGRSTDERRPWLAFGGAVQVMHGEVTSDEDQTTITEQFGLRDAPVRLLFTGDIASEGVNLHQQCHLLVHYDLPWSLIRIEQRNGRIDRYGQEHAPQFRALILTSDLPWRTDLATNEPRSLDDRLVGEKLLLREQEAHRIEGSAEAVTGLFRAKDEENRLVHDLIAGQSVDQSILISKQGAQSFLADLMGNLGTESQTDEVPRANVLSVFGSRADYFDEGLRQICTPNPEDQLKLRRDEDGTIAFEPPSDLLYRLKALPKSYLDEQRILPSKDEPGRMRVTFSEQLGLARLKAARETTKTQWPNVSYITDIHPVMDWLTDKVLAEVGRHQAPVLAGAVDEPVFLVQGIYSNALGRPTVIEWMAVSSLAGTPQIEPITQDVLERLGLGPRMPGRRQPHDLPGLSAKVPIAVDAAAEYLNERAGQYRQQVADILHPYRTRVEVWQQTSLLVSKSSSHERVTETATRLQALAASLEPAGKPMLRVLAVLEPQTPTGTHA
ncbi:DEAD/DEAH box helicase [Kineosporia babensis]|uniref:DEAD/DEAH box helicase n=1 Tax=Kineosporia babensis TaxID=499548 RepID=A0A9X1NLD8_9ACTN|nr:DEAD/DEAH box helicase [Kineosporia babensis]MCD5317102.1 DEAD/DEAH box helicase [Kineosporia babensis]